MSPIDSTAQFADHLVAIQKALYAYILTLLPWPDEASDVLQQTNLTLWRDAAKFQPGTDFRAWAYRVAYFQVLAQRRKIQRDRLRFDDTFLKHLADHLEREAYNSEEESLALHDCLARLSDEERELIRRRYDTGVSVKVLAAQLHQSPNVIAVRLHRIRQALLECVRQRLSEREPN